MKKEYILFIDSGIGGLTTLAKTTTLVTANFIYFADNKNCPYGNLTKKQIAGNLKGIILNLGEKFSIKLIVLACNTATTSSIKFLRQEFPMVSFVGTEPAICLAKKLGYKKIYAITTPATAKQTKYKKLAKQTNAKTIASPTLAFNIENYFLSKTIFYYFNILKEIYNISSKTKSADCLVLGCTHYPLVGAMIKNITGKPTINGNLGVAKRVKFLAENQSLSKKFSAKSTIKFLCSKPHKSANKNYKKIFNQILANKDIMC